MTRPQVLRITLFCLTAAVITITAVFFHVLMQRMKHDEQQKIELWAEATTQIIHADRQTDIDFFSQVIESNTTIPVYITDTMGSVIMSRNDDRSEKRIQKTVNELRTEQEPIVVPLYGNQKQYIYHSESKLLTVLRFAPLLQLLFIAAILALAITAYTSIKNAEQQQMWLGLTKETAHQLGTPVSSLNAWVTLLMEKYPDDEIIPEIEKDTQRLQTISQRFSKIGSTPELKPTDINATLKEAVTYMQQRTSQQVVFKLNCVDQPKIVMLNAFLFNWAIENLCKNAVDAMDGKGTISIDATHETKRVIIDITDTGKGIDSSDFKNVFRPGYTTKQRGWGLGLSLTKRIIEDYHNGRIYILKSEHDKGTTFRIEIG